MVIRELIKSIIDSLRDVGIDNPIFEAHQLIRCCLKLSPLDLVLKHNALASDSEINAVNELLKRRLGGEPLQYILGTQEFMSLEFAVNKNVLIPRADTEVLVEYVLNTTKNKGFVLLDIGTGTGCIPLSIAHYNQRAFVRGIDISDAALEVAKHNSENLKLTNRADFEKLDILNDIPHGKYDIITSNPPYIERKVIETLQTEVKDFEPKLALDGGEDGLIFYKRICSIAPDILSCSGMLVFEIGYHQAEAVKNLMSKRFCDIKIIKDLCGNDRVVTGKLN